MSQVDLFPRDIFPRSLCSQVFGETWSAPLLSIKIDDIVGSVEKELAERELALKHAKGKKRGKASSKTSEANAVTVDDNEDVWSIPSDDENAGRASNSGTAKAPKNSEKDAAAAARKEQRLREQAWKKEVAKAAKCIQSLNSSCSSLAFLLNKSEKSPGCLNADLVTGLKEANVKLTDLKGRTLAVKRFCLFSNSSFKRCDRYIIIPCKIKIVMRFLLDALLYEIKRCGRCMYS